MPGWNERELRRLLDDLTGLRASVLRLEEESEALLAEVAESHVPSARNLLHYVALRRHDLRVLQERLARLGLSSLGRSEGCVLDTLDRVVDILHRLHGSADSRGVPAIGVPDFTEGRALLESHTEALLGPVPDKRSVRIMVTMPGEAAEDPVLIRDLLQAGMDCMRINCAHDNPDVWQRMIANLRQAEQEQGRKCRVLMDLPGPKLRTGELADGPQVLKWRPQRDTCGRVLAPARVWLTPADHPQPAPSPADASLPVAAHWLSRLAQGSRIVFRDARGAARQMTVNELSAGGCWTECRRTAYVATGTVLRLRQPGIAPTREDETPVGELPAQTLSLVLKKGDRLILTRDPKPGENAETDATGHVTQPARVPCTLPEVFADLCSGERVWLDDGKIGGIIRSVNFEQVEIEITHAAAKGAKLGADKGINFPDSTLRLPALTSQDLQDLDFVAAHADLVGLSFVHSAADVSSLQEHLLKRGGERLGIVLKIETRRGFEALPRLLLAAMRSRCIGVMIARGDLAVECGYERLAELQEEILWVCEAAHVPVIWATQVLEHLAKDGMPSRAEITDAAMGERAECVMLNKGPHIREAVTLLTDILRRMQAHQSKKRSMLRPLKLAAHFATAATR